MVNDKGVMCITGYKNLGDLASAASKNAHIKREGYMVNDMGERCITGHHNQGEEGARVPVRDKNSRATALGEYHSHICISAICQRGVSIKWKGGNVRMYHHCYDPEQSGLAGQKPRQVRGLGLHVCKKCHRTAQKCRETSCLAPACSNNDPPSLLHWTVCLSFLQQILAHQNFSRVCTTFLLRHFHVSTGLLRLLRQSSRGRKRLYALNLELIHHHPFIETRTSPHTQPLSSGPPDPNSRPPPPNPSQQSHARSGPLRQPSLPVSALGKRPIPVSSNVDSNKKQKTLIVRFFPLYPISSQSHSQHSWYDSRKMGFYSGSRHLSVSRLHHLD